MIIVNCFTQKLIFGGAILKKIDNVILIGVGAIGSFFAPKLLDTLGADKFHIIAGGERRERLRRHGLTINGEVFSFPILAPGQTGHIADLILIGVKSLALGSALNDIESFVGPDTIIMPLLNGVSSEELTVERYGQARVLPSFMRVSVVMENYCCSYDPDFGAVFFGEADGRISERISSISALFESAGIGYKVSNDINHDIWFKFMANIGENLTCALLGIPFGAFTISEHANYIRVAAMMEVIAIAGKLGVSLGERELDSQVDTIAKIPFSNKPSTLQDLEAGRKTEIDMFAGEVMRLGEKLGVQTPVNSILYHAVRTLEEKNDGLFKSSL